MPLKNKAQNKEYWRQHYLANKEHRLANAKIYYAANKEKIFDTNRRYRMKRVYGMSVEEYDGMVIAQGNQCAICKKNSPGGRTKLGRWHIDHCHESNRVRGLLCLRCNMALGWHEKHRGTAEMYMQASEEEWYGQV